MPRRPRRQGVVYGPASFRRGPDNVTLVGRLIGAIVVIGALIALLVGALAVVGGGGNGPRVTPSPTSTALSSPSGSLGPGPTPTLQPTPSPTPVASPSVSPSAVPVVIMQGPGNITFGTNYSSPGFRIQNMTVNFPATGPIAWSANIGTAVGTDQMTLTVSAINPADNSETITHTETVSTSNPSAIVFLERSRVEQITSGPGTYVMRYTHNGTVVSTGYFRVNG